MSRTLFTRTLPDGWTLTVEQLPGGSIQATQVGASDGPQYAVAGTVGLALARLAASCGRHVPEFQPNARLWVWSGEWCRITLKPGQTLSRCEGGPTDEGHNHCARTWEHEGNGVSETVTNWGRDCDGGYETGRDYFCPLDRLASNLHTDEFEEPLLMGPTWEDARRYQRDYSAEAAGY